MSSQPSFARFIADVEQLLEREAAVMGDVDIGLILSR